jgi:hypothetical protein
MRRQPHLQGQNTRARLGTAMGQHFVMRGEDVSASIVEGWLTRIAAGKSFVDIGGLGGNISNERVTMAHKAGSARIAMADILEAGHKWWRALDQKCSECGMVDLERYPGFDLMTLGSETRLGSFDVVNSTGIMYHCADMLGYMRKLRAVTSKFAITSMVTMPPVLENENGRFETPPGACVFLPSLNESQRRVLQLHYDRKFINMLSLEKISPRASHETVAHYVRDGQLSTMPNWWFISREALHAMITICEFGIEEEYIFRDHASVLLLKAS